MALDRVRQPERADPLLELEPGRLGADEQEPRARVARANDRKRLEQLRDALVRVQEAEAADHRLALDRSRLGGRLGPNRHRDLPDRPVEARASARVADVVGVDDQAVLPARSSTSPASGKSSGRVDQSGGTQPSTTPRASRRPSSPASRSIAFR